MAAREHRVSRRALLGAAFATAFVARHPAVASLEEAQGRGTDSSGVGRATGWTLKRVQGDEQWGHKLARFRRAEAVLKAAVHEPDEDRYGDLVVAFNRALRKLLRTPAPDLPALALKIDLTVDHEVAELTGGDACLAALKRDGRRLAASAV
jgi:hypothetical protein